MVIITIDKVLGTGCRPPSPTVVICVIVVAVAPHIGPAAHVCGWVVPVFVLAEVVCGCGRVVPVSGAAKVAGETLDPLWFLDSRYTIHISL